ncbi:MAG TPA: M13 family metallopeptidase [Hyphomonadaceae bacterium]|nr:M13 family metallopeptidase [Hyphomonadaceae bacterium]
MNRRALFISAAAIVASAFAVAFAQGIDVTGIDKSVKPGDDFFAYANGTWLKTAEIPADRSSWGGNGILAEKVDKDVADLIQGMAAKKPKAGTEAAKIADYYSAYMDEAGIEAKGAAPLKPELERIAAIKDRKGLSAYLGSQLRADMDAMNNTKLTTDNVFGLWVAADFDKPTVYSAFLLQGGLSLPNREYYTSDSPRMASIRDGFKTHIAAVLDLGGIKDSKAKAEKIFALEDKIARVHASLVDSEDPEKGNNHWPYADLAKKAPGMDWVEFLKASGLSSQKSFVIWQPSAFTGEAKLVADTPVDTWKDYLTFHYIDRNSGVLPKAFVDERFNFYGKTLSGTPALTDRWKRAIAAVNGSLGEAVGKLYVAKHFPASSKVEVSTMVKNITAAFDKRIDALDWMNPATKKEAKAKLKALKVGIGYPDKWRSYAGLVVKKDDAFGNAQRAAKFDSDFKIARLGKPVDRGEWVMNPQLVNAVNLPILNALNFPAAELQPPHFDPKAPAAVNYGSIGAIIGHEISHSFDNSGAQFDSQGRMRNWWTKEDFAHFDASGKALATQFDGYKPFPDVAIKGEQTLSENIADVAGLSAAYDAYRTSLGGKAGPEAAGFSSDQQFFISFGQTWRNKTREAALRQQVLTDGHAPAQYRALTVRNLDAWYSAFDVKPGEALYLAPKDRVKVW